MKAFSFGFFTVLIGLVPFSGTVLAADYSECNGFLGTSRYYVNDFKFGPDGQAQPEDTSGKFTADQIYQAPGKEPIHYSEIVFRIDHSIQPVSRAYYGDRGRVSEVQYSAGGNVSRVLFAYDSKGNCYVTKIKWDGGPSHVDYDQDVCMAVGDFLKKNPFLKDCDNYFDGGLPDGALKPPVTCTEPKINQDVDAFFKKATGGVDLINSMGKPEGTAQPTGRLAAYYRLCTTAYKYHLDAARKMAALAKKAGEPESAKSVGGGRAASANQ